MDTKQIERITQLVVAALCEAPDAREDRTKRPEGIPVGVSARHVHLTQEQVELLFGKGHHLTPKKELMGGQFACEETVTLISPKMKVLEKVRVLGPTRKTAQIELAATDAMKLGVKAPLRDSGDVAGSAPLTLLGPAGTLTLREGTIIAGRHIHMSPADAARFGVTDGQIVSVRFPGERAGLFGQVKIRVDDSFTLEMHIDTDEANAACIKTGTRVELVK